MNALRLTLAFFLFVQAAAASDPGPIRRRTQNEESEGHSESHDMNIGEAQDQEPESASDSDDMKSMIRQNIKRVCEKSAKSNNVEAECSAKEGKMKDKIKFEIYAGRKGAEIDVKYKGKEETDLVETETEEEYAIIFHSIVEYIPNTDGAPYDYDDEEGKVQEIKIKEFTDFSDIDEDGDGVSTFYVATADEVARFDFHLSQEENDIRNLSANSVKVDISINNFPWMQNNTFLALLCTIEAETEIKYDYEKPVGEDDVKLDRPKDVRITLEGSPGESAIKPFGKFDWMTTAEMNNNTYTSEIVASMPSDAEEGDKKKQIAFSFLDSSNAENIYWDPEAGIGYEESDTSGSFTIFSNVAWPISAVAVTLSYFISI